MRCSEIAALKSTIAIMSVNLVNLEKETKSNGILGLTLPYPL